MHHKHTCIHTISRSVGRDVPDPIRQALVRYGGVTGLHQVVTGTQLQVKTVRHVGTGEKLIHA